MGSFRDKKQFFMQSIVPNILCVTLKLNKIFCDSMMDFRCILIYYNSDIIKVVQKSFPLTFNQLYDLIM